jgi:hypothetical protein
MPNYTWRDAEARVKEEYAGDHPWTVSARRHLLRIIVRAEQWGIAPDYFMEAGKSSLREIIRECRSAMARGKRDRLENLFRWAATLTVKELRLQIKDLIRETIVVREIPGEYASRYVMLMQQDQFDRIKRATELSYNYEIVQKQE